MAQFIFTPTAYTALGAQSISSAVQLPVGGSANAVLITNLGPVSVFVQLGDGSVTTTPQTGLGVAPGSSVLLSLAGNTYLAAITNAAQGVINIAVGISSGGGASGAGLLISGINTVSYSTTPVFDASLGSYQVLTLNGDVSVASLINVQPGQEITFFIFQDINGGHNFPFPSMCHGAANIGPAYNTANPLSCTAQTFKALSTSAMYAIGTADVNQ